MAVIGLRTPRLLNMGSFFIRVLNNVLLPGKVKCLGTFHSSNVVGWHRISCSLTITVQNTNGHVILGAGPECGMP